MPTYKTPGVYVEEISVFPPSVAEVETAVPAFIGYTQKHEYRGEDLKMIPTEVDSLKEYQERFGGESPMDIQSISLDGNNNVTKVEAKATFYMYDSLRMYFLNGGGKCYVISLGTYSAPIAKADFQAGLKALRKEDEPTLILFPDAVLLNPIDHLYDIQQEALQQAALLGDRFVIMDLSEPSANAVDWKNKVKEFRNKIGINNLKYGAAYTPYLKTTIPHRVRYRDLVKNNAVTVGSLTSDPMVGYTIANLEKATADVNAVQAASAAPLASIAKAVKVSELDKEWKKLSDSFLNVANSGVAATTLAEFLKLFALIYEANDAFVDEWATTLKDYVPVPAGATKPQTLKERVEQLITNRLNLLFLDLGAYGADLARIGGGNSISVTASAPQWTANLFDMANFDTNFAAETTAAIAKLYPNPGGNDAGQILNMKNALSYIDDVFRGFLQVLQQVQADAATQEATFESSLMEQLPAYRNIVNAVGNQMSVLPPSGGVAGAYAATDASRGVWKAPANVSLNSVSGPTVALDSADQEDLNVDTTAGKSINAIRYFTGKGVLIWGARTLAGNDNEWRYVPVRRFYNMVEESVKKSTGFAVFEPNDANLWLKVRTMIENYLTEKWREGALAGAKPEHAFFVKVGLGTTMSAQDILEGRMIVEIGMAVVRPAEFIILRFSHMLQQS